METRFTDQTGITISCDMVHSPNARVGVKRWAHYTTDHRGQHKVGPWYGSKDEILADHEDYLKRAGWLVEAAA